MLSKPQAWSQLSEEAQQRLSALLPPAKDGTKHDPKQHPIKGRLASPVREAIERWQDDLVNGRELKTFRAHKVETTRDEFAFQSSAGEEEAEEEGEEDEEE